MGRLRSRREVNRKVSVQPMKIYCVLWRRRVAKEYQYSRPSAYSSWVLGSSIALNNMTHMNSYCTSWVSCRKRLVQRLSFLSVRQLERRSVTTSRHTTILLICYLQGNWLAVYTAPNVVLIRIVSTLPSTYSFLLRSTININTIRSSFLSIDCSLEECLNLYFKEEMIDDFWKCG